MGGGGGERCCAVSPPLLSHVSSPDVEHIKYIPTVCSSTRGWRLVFIPTRRYYSMTKEQHVGTVPLPPVLHKEDISVLCRTSYINI